MSDLVIVPTFDVPEDERHLAMLVAGKNALFSCSEDPQLEDARKCFKAMCAAASPSSVNVEEIVRVLAGAEEFISNGIEFGFIRMPDKDDPAINTLPEIRALLSKLKSPSQN